MISPAPFLKKQTATRSKRLFKGDDYRYLYVLNRKDQTVSVIDTSTNTVSATITLTAAKVFSSLAYRPLDKTVWVFGTNSVDVIDANPSSGGFNTFTNYTTTTGAGAGVIYDFNTDCFIYAAKIINAKGRGETAVVNMGSISSNVVWHKTRTFFCSNISLAFHSSFTLNSYKSVTPVIMPAWVQSHNVEPIKVGNYFYSGASSVLTKYDYSTKNPLVTLSVTQAALASTAYDPTNNRIWIGTSVNGSTSMQVIRLDTFVVDSTEARTAGLDTNESATRDILYCPYNGYIYAKASNTSNPATGLGRVHYYDPSLTGGSRYVNYVAVGQDGSGGLYSRDTMCFNGLKTHEFK